MPLTLRPSAARGHANHGWLDSHHSFSFADYHDPAHMGFRDLRVINDDVIAGGEGFPTHGHRDMEIVTYVVRGALAHKDSTGAEGVIRRGDVQAMSAGTGVRHSEFNGSAHDDVRLLQIWIMPDAANLLPAYTQAHFSDSEKRNSLRLLAAPKPEGGALPIHQDARIYASLLEAGHSLSHKIGQGRGVWLQMVDGAVEINGTAAQSGDGAAIEDMDKIEIRAQKDSEFLLFDLA